MLELRGPRRRGSRTAQRFGGSRGAGASLKDLDYLGEPACEEGPFSVSPHLRLLHPLSGDVGTWMRRSGS